MRSERKKVLIGMVVGVLLLGGGGYGYVHAVDQVRAEAESWQGQPPPMMQVDPEKAAKHIAEAFGIDESEVRAAIEAKRDFRDIGHAAMLAKISGKSFKDILALKKDGKDWREVEEELQVTQEQIHGVMMEMEARHLAAKGSISEGRALALLQDGYRSFDIFEAAEIDGASKWQTFWYITMPLLKETIRTALVFFFINAFSGVFTLVNVMTDGAPAKSTEVMTNYMYRIAFQQSNMGYATAIGVVVFLFVLFLTGIMLLLTRSKDVLEY